MGEESEVQGYDSGKAGEYMERAEKLKQHLAGEDKGSKKKPAAVGSNGKVSGSGGRGSESSFTVTAFAGFTRSLDGF